ncbi:MAG: tetratricopeptide repeat protein [Candidatus Binatia bacterium]
MQSATVGRRAVVAAALFLSVVALYAPVREFGFVNLDDNEYVTENPYVRSGLSRENVEWAAKAFHSGHWHPLTWIALMTDCEWSGTDPRALHLVNVLLHGAGSAVLFLCLYSATRGFWLSAFVAALFALHPLRVESVAWVAARKDVLSGLFLMLTLWAWVAYAKRPSLGRYALVMVAYGLGLLSKPTLAVVPAGLVLLDHWPLGRRSLSGSLSGENRSSSSEKTESASLGWLLVEKLPLVALAFLTLTQTWAAQHAAGAVVDESLSLATRIANASWHYGLYLRRTLWPFDLAVFYPLRPAPVPGAAAVAIGVAALTLVAWRLRARRPYLLAGWLWFLGMLVPVSGIIQFGGQSVADRYTYIPHIGLFLALGWLAHDLLRRWPAARTVLAVLLLVGLAARSRDQLQYWRDSTALFERALAVTEENYFAHNNLGVALQAAGRQDEAARHYQEAVRLNPTWPEALNNLGIAHAWRGDFAGARGRFEDALRVRPDFARAENNIGTAYGREGNYERAIEHYARAVELEPTYFDALFGLADALERRGRRDEAAATYRSILELRPGFPPAITALARLGGPAS